MVLRLDNLNQTKSQMMLPLVSFYRKPFKQFQPCLSLINPFM